jgi:thiol-disulfide isomerase/thioredoxin
MLGVFVILGVSVYAYLTSEAYAVSTQSKTLVGESYREIVTPSGFVNTEDKEIMLSEYVGARIVLIEFMRYGCANCQRSFPHIVALSEKYGPNGLAIIGIHTPQFPHEALKSNVEKAMDGAGITFPVVLDNEYATWSAYENHYWPRTILIDRTGTIVYDHIGAGDYDAMERKIQELLR